jgi:hypothetical protein
VSDLLLRAIGEYGLTMLAVLIALLAAQTVLVDLFAQRVRKTPSAAIHTFSGVSFDVANPRAADVRIEDIAHALALQCRFNGHTRHFYSVAQHSVLVSYEVPDSVALDALLHDAAEAYVGDIVRPVRRAIPEFDAMEARVHRTIAERFGVRPTMPSEVREADDRVLAREKEDLLPGLRNERPDPYRSPVDNVSRIVPVLPEEAERLFLARFAELSRRRETVSP